MKCATIQTNWPIRVVVSQSRRWAQIRYKNRVLHTGSFKYIKRIARERFNAKVTHESKS